MLYRYTKLIKLYKNIVKVYVCFLILFGANDLGGIMMEEVVVSATGIKNMPSIQEIVNMVKSAGKIPVQRNSKYEILRYF